MNEKLLGVLAGVALFVFLFWPAGSSKKVIRLYNEAERLYSQNDYEGAIRKYYQALEESAKWGVKTQVIDKDFNTLANYKIAINYSRWAEQSGRIAYYDNAIEQIEKVAPHAAVPKHQEGLTYLWGHVLYKQEKFELAESKFRTLIELFPNSVFVENAWYAIGMLNYRLEKYEAARQAYKEVLDRFPNSRFKDDILYRQAEIQDIIEPIIKRGVNVEIPEFPSSDSAIGAIKWDEIAGIKIGYTLAQVKSIRGEPQGREYYRYPDIGLEFSLSSQLKLVNRITVTDTSPLRTNDDHGIGSSVEDIRSEFPCGEVWIQSVERARLDCGDLIFGLIGNPKAGFPYKVSSIILTD